MGALVALLLAAAPAGCTAEEQGVPYAVCFDPGNRLALSAGMATTGDVDFEAVLAFRRSRESRTLEHLSWSTEHRFGDLELQWPSRQLDVTAYEGLYLRHLDEGFVLVPTRTPFRLPFPFDVAVATDVAHYERTEREGWGRRLEVIRASLLLDAARDPTGVSRLAFGPSLAYAMEPGPGGRPVSLLEPLSALELRARHESADGLWAAQARGDVGWELVPGGESGLRATADGSLQRVLLAIDDQLVALQLEGKLTESRAGTPYRERRLMLSVVLGLGR